MEHLPGMSLSTVVGRQAGFVEAEIEKEIVALNVEKGTCYGLNSRFADLEPARRPDPNRRPLRNLAEYKVEPSVRTAGSRPPRGVARRRPYQHSRRNDRACRPVAFRRPSRCRRGVRTYLGVQELYGPHAVAQWTAGDVAFGRRLMRVLPEEMHRSPAADRWRRSLCSRCRYPVGQSKRTDRSAPDPVAASTQSLRCCRPPRRHRAVGRILP